ncbi:gamma-glutamyl-gamma-aminobutyrate hydrolase family protein [Hahella sp. KA22]|uniref:gamma-glutamyl-gamma-aminobutyrate hydrolase family protein n=1 Tax=Hahella sp. KA22 TaxID=1628392 RepID=UPI000FDEB0AA|nr:gamma-glutamyl-gamma-aminobutyrate hydrolase family protein [Hahella sp. KA22]AZZ92172.1 gamma-glutamyl-gamma-aminobutyrate hydrolase family protein [Hahella sp. KA22]QAY55543.1 gamma-glutamyl-gamma-aminobutyrate hydrolase family protein [Hahella sp. KA22]
MDTRLRVGVTGSGRKWSPSWWCAQLALRMAGAHPERISVRHAPSGIPLDALIIGGGDDISPEHYNGDINEKVKIDPDRDALEIAWIHKALEHNIPLLGICRGAQLINCVLGGALHQDIRHMRKLTYNRPGLLPTKQVQLEKDSRMSAICGSRKLRVNSLHHQAIKVPGAGLKVVGRDLDFIVQAVECVSGRKIIGVQWHPEYLFYLPSQFALFRWLLQEQPHRKHAHASSGRG